MKISESTWTPAILEELGQRIAAVRLAKNLTQPELAHMAGIGVNTLQRIESGRPSTLDTFVDVLRALSLVDRLDILVPDRRPGPMDLLKRRGRERRRAAGRRVTRSDKPGQTWRWGDEHTP